jgi:hypothetical protein
LHHSHYPGLEQLIALEAAKAKAYGLSMIKMRERERERERERRCPFLTFSGARYHQFRW